MIASQTGPRARSSKRLAVIIVLIAAGGLLPLLLYNVWFGFVPMVSPAEARQLLQAPDTAALLIDVRPAEEFDETHIEGAHNWPLADIRRVESPFEVPGQFRGGPLFLVCNSGILSTAAVRHLDRLGVENVINVRGGIQEWIASVDEPEDGPFAKLSALSGRMRPLPFRRAPAHEQFVAVLSGFAIKPTYTLLSLVLVIVLWRRRESDLVALRWSMIFFFVGENFCAVNYIFFGDTSYLVEYLHSFGMLLSAAFATYAIIEGVDGRILMLSDSNHRCAAVRLCGKCIKYEDVPCGLRRVSYMVLPALALVALMPLCAPLQSNAYNTVIYGTFYRYGHKVVYQLFEMRFCPVVAAVLLIACMSVLVLKSNPYPWAKLLLAAAAGPLTFALFRSVIGTMFSQDLVWFAFWEEFTELLFIVGVCLVLWIFRQRLFENSATASPP
ncbi:MAG: rhodanese-like domain-containing protein [Phycisphaerae bacterium]|nr:rhodanese-like domain-containing protein [Phycisphaerae bacterium]